MRIIGNRLWKALPIVVFTILICTTHTCEVVNRPVAGKGKATVKMGLLGVLYIPICSCPLLKVVGNKNIIGIAVEQYQNIFTDPLGFSRLSHLFPHVEDEVFQLITKAKGQAASLSSPDSIGFKDGFPIVFASLPSSALPSAVNPSPQQVANRYWLPVAPIEEFVILKPERQKIYIKRFLSRFSTKRGFVLTRFSAELSTFPGVLSDLGYKQEQTFRSPGYQLVVYMRDF